MNSMVLALAIIMSPVDKNVNYDKYDSVDMRHSLMAVSIQLELMDPREVSHWWNYRQFNDGCKELQVRYADLVDCPEVADSLRFPSREFCRNALEFNWNYTQHLENHLEIACDIDKPWIEEAIKESIQLRRLWSSLEDTQAGYYYVYVKRRALREVRDTVGLKNYYQGILPPYVPLQYFQRIDK